MLLYPGNEIGKLDLVGEGEHRFVRAVEVWNTFAPVFRANPAILQS
jgi:hypothetical protein